ncbi:MAG: phosphocholine cytidylyltransferase family protein [Hyphomicrobiales bacterium]|nr:phosphocholine cytidylyltransferase family protein [Hyphomicrobiales bacterium]
MRHPSRPVRHAVILAAGLGSRLRPLTRARPKPLVEVHGVPILHNTLACLARAGVRRATIVVGYRKELIVQSCGRSFAGVRITYCESSVFDRTGSAYSLWLARDALCEDSLLIEGDVMFESRVVDRLLHAAPGDVAAVAPFTPPMTGSAVRLTPAAQVASVHLSQTADNPREARLFKLVNLTRFSGRTLRERIVPALGELVTLRSRTAYVEQLLEQLIDRGELELATTQCGDLKWFEIDSPDDLRIAERIFASEPARLRPVHAHAVP